LDDYFGVIGDIGDHCCYFGSDFYDITEIGDDGLDFKQVDLMWFNPAELFRMVRLLVREQRVFICCLVVDTIIGYVCGNSHLLATRLAQRFYDSNRQLLRHLEEGLFACLRHLRDHEVYSFLRDPDMGCEIIPETNKYLRILVIVADML
jgi:hypothetical protein